MIDLRSDTLTKPSPELRAILSQASVGDDAFGEDFSVSELEEYTAALFGTKKALFMPSGTMSNQVAVKSHTTPGSEVITDACYHINFFESAQTAAFSGVSLNLTHATKGRMTPSHLEQALSEKYKGDYYATPKLLFLENTINSGCGAYFAVNEMESLCAYARKAGLNVHIDGARLLNACVASETKPAFYGTVVDSLSLCFAKGLGAPFGSILMGSTEFIHQAKIYRKWFGGQLHQAGFMARAALYTLKQNWQQKLKEDHQKASLLVASIENCYPSHLVDYQGSNIVMISMVGANLNARQVIQELKQNGLDAFPWTENRIRLVTHQDISFADIKMAQNILSKVLDRIHFFPVNATHQLSSLIH